ncbi:MAG: polysaccharide biosynthesis C-terminal domain-containing protein [Bacteroidetes bacterium]|nr:polysaccharide biosynthesis C-terminal domain-containing protein [Bacteroidota bacterium]
MLVPIFIGKLGPELYGVWVLNFAIFGYFYAVDASISSGVIKYISEAKAINDQTLLLESIYNSLITYLFFGILIFIFSQLLINTQMLTWIIHDKEYLNIIKKMIFVSGIFAVVLWPLLVFPAVLQGLLKHTVLNLLKGITALLQQIVLITAIFFTTKMENLLTLFFLVSFISGMVLYYLVKRQIKREFISIKLFNYNLLKKISKFSGNIFVLEIFSMLAYQTDKIILALLLPIESLTIYDIISKLFYSLRSFYGMFLKVIQPMIFRAKKANDKAFIEKMIIKGTKYLNIIYIPLIILGIVISKPFITIWMGDTYGQYGYWSSFYIAQYLFTPMIGLIGTVVIGLSKTKMLQIFSLISVSLNLIISIIAVQLYGFPGVLIGTVFSSFLIVPILYKFYCDAADIDWRVPIKANWKISLSQIIIFLLPGMIISNLFIKTWFELIFFILIFIIAVYVFHFIFFVDKEDKLIIFPLLTKIFRVPIAK